MTTGGVILGVLIAIAALCLLWFGCRIAWIILKDAGARIFLVKAATFLFLLSVCVPFHIFGLLVLGIVWYSFFGPLFGGIAAAREIDKQVRQNFDTGVWTSGTFVSLYDKDEIIGEWDVDTGKVTVFKRRGFLRHAPSHLEVPQY